MLQTLGLEGHPRESQTIGSDPTAAVVQVSPCAYRLLSLRIIMAESFVLLIFPE